MSLFSLWVSLLVLPAGSARTPAAMLTDNVAPSVGFRTSNVKCLLSPVFTRFCLVPLDTVISVSANVDVLIASPMSTANGTGLAFVGLDDVDVIAGVGFVRSMSLFSVLETLLVLPAGSARTPAAMLTDNVAPSVGFRTSNVK